MFRPKVCGGIIDVTSIESTAAAARRSLPMCLNRVKITANRKSSSTPNASYTVSIKYNHFFLNKAAVL